MTDYPHPGSRTTTTTHDDATASSTVADRCHRRVARDPRRLRAEAPTGEAGPLTETLYTLPSDVPAPLLSDGSSAWGLNSWSSTSRSHLSGGVSPGDLDGDVYGDLVIAGGTVVVFLNDGSRFTLLEDPNTLLPSDALSTLIIDLDADGYGDIVIGSDDGAAIAIWGGPWLRSGGPRQAEVTELAGRSMTTGILAGNLDADATVDLVALG